MIDAAIDDAKAGLRAAAHRKRAAIHSGARTEAAKAAAAHFFDGVVLRPNDVVALYWPIRDELDCKPVLTRLMDAGQPVCLPVVIGDGMPLELRLWQDGAPLYPSGFGTLAPAEDAPLAEPDVIVMPLLGFDRLGTRLGYGGGYYDRTLEILGKAPRLIGYAFADQEMDLVPREPHDVPLDAVVTEAGYRSFAKGEV
jgi:5-formyltetrahydrofolate cyclo-ligase